MYCVDSCSLSLEISAAHVMNCVDPRRIDEFAVFVVDKYGDDLLSVPEMRLRVLRNCHPFPARSEIYRESDLQGFVPGGRILGRLEGHCGSAVLLRVMQNRVIFLAAKSKPHT
jgi:hypothetical protein